MSWAALLLGACGLVVLVVLVGVQMAVRDELRRIYGLLRDYQTAERWAQEMEDVRSQEIEGLREELLRLQASGTQELLRKRVVANLADGSSIRGVLTADHPEVIVLEHAEYLNGRQPEHFSGRAVLPRAHVLWFQALGDER